MHPKQIDLFVGIVRLYTHLLLKINGYRGYQREHPGEEDTEPQSEHADIVASGMRVRVEQRYLYDCEQDPGPNR